MMYKLPYNEQEVRIEAVRLGITVGPFGQSVGLNVVATSVDNVKSTVIS